jgi:hypothetical protein
MIKRIVVMLICMLFLSPPVKAKGIEYRYPFYCSKDTVQEIVSWGHPIPLVGQGGDRIFVCYEGSPITLKIFDGGKIAHKVRITKPNVYHQINLTVPFLRIFVESDGESSFDIDFYTIEPWGIVEANWINIAGNMAYLTECSSENYELCIAGGNSVAVETWGMEKGEVRVRYEENESTVISDPLMAGSAWDEWKEYDATDPLPYPWPEGWSILLTNLKGAGDFFVYTVANEKNIISVYRPRNFGPSPSEDNRPGIVQL